MGITILLILFVVFWVIPRLFKYIIAYWLYRRSRDFYRPDEGKTFLEQKEKPKEKIVDKSIGEYVNYEEEESK